MMESKMKRIHRHIDSIRNYLTPLLPFANCHMVDYFVNNHWERFVPSDLRHELEGWELKDALDVFWNQSLEGCEGSSLLSTFIRTARSHYLRVDNEICVSVDDMKAYIQEMGCEIRQQISVKEFMSAKKSYEVQIMSSLVASLFSATSSTHCVDLGGGAGHLGVVLDLGYNVPSLAIDCDVISMEGGKKRDILIKVGMKRVEMDVDVKEAREKQWQSIAKGANAVTNKSGNLHHYCQAYVRNDTDLCQIINEQFGERNEDIKILLTGLHTCGNLGSDSLRLFTTMKHMGAIFNVPCCYHLLTEVCDENPMWNAFDKTCCEDSIVDGFPMSQYLYGFQLGRNARMLAAQSVDRVLLKKELPSKSLLYRAVLQQIIKKEIPNRKIAIGELKRIFKKTTSFLQYFREADKILNLELHALTDSYLTDEFDSCQLRWKNMAMFHLLRISLSQVIESLILLDRVLFLYENGYNNAFLVKLYDAAVSPRCHGIVAVT